MREGNRQHFKCQTPVGSMQSTQKYCTLIENRCNKQLVFFTLLELSKRRLTSFLSCTHCCSSHTVQPFSLYGVGLFQFSTFTAVFLISFQTMQFLFSPIIVSLCKVQMSTQYRLDSLFRVFDWVCLLVIFPNQRCCDQIVHNRPTRFTNSILKPRKELNTQNHF